MLKIIYRICDLRDGGTKIPRITKQQCFLNFIEVFGTANLVIIADNTRSETIDFLSRYTTNIEKTSLGNSGSFLHALDLALGYDDDQPIYLVEDDYLHHAKGPVYIAEGLAHADYVNLYDHADKYMQPSPNPLVSDGGENTKVIFTASSHWKYTNSTTMTFAAKAKTIRADQQIFRHYCSGKIPMDFHIFRQLSEIGRTLITPIPGRSTHCDEFPSPLFFESPIPMKQATSRSGTQRIVPSTPQQVSA